MRVKVGGPFATTQPDGVTVSHRPGSTVEIPEDDPAVLAHWRQLVRAGMAEELTEDDTDDPDEVSELRGQAETLGVRIDRRWGPQRLRTEIQRATTGE